MFKLLYKRQTLRFAVLRTEDTFNYRKLTRALIKVFKTNMN